MLGAATGARRIARALLLAVALLVATEAALRLLGGDPPDLRPPVPFSDARDEVPFWPLSEDRHLIGCGVRRQVFRIPRPAGTFRIFVVGSSAVYGTRMPLFQGIPFLLERRLDAAAPSVDWEVINLGVPGVASTLERVLVRRVLDRYQPDLVIWMDGNNEFYMLRAYKWLHPEWDGRVETLRRWMWRSALYRALARGARSFPHPDFQAQEHEGFGQGMDAVTVSDWDRALARDILTANLQGMARDCAEAGVRFMAIPAPGHDFYIDSRVTDLDARFAQMVTRHDALCDEGDVEGARRLLEAACDGSEPPLVSMRLAGDLALLGQAEAALRVLRGAHDRDPRPISALPSFREAALSLSGTLVCDVEAAVRARTHDGLIGDEQFQDACHPRPGVNAWIADAIVASLQDAGVVPRGGPPAPMPHAVRDLEQWPGAADSAWSERVPASVRSALREAEQAQLVSGEGAARLRAAIPLSHPSVDVLAVAGHALFTWERWDDAAEYYREALRREPDHPLLLRDLGHAWFYGGHYREALSVYARFLQGREDRGLRRLTAYFSGFVRPDGLDAQLPHAPQEPRI